MSEDIFKHMESGEDLPSPEKEKQVETKVILELMRHGKREYGLDAEGKLDLEKDANPDLRLKPEGRQQSYDRGKELNPQAEVSLGLGSPRVRSQETAYQTMLANEDISPDDTFEEIEKKIANKVTVGKKMIVDDRLNFVDSGPVAAEGKKAYLEKRYMQWVINDSDMQAIEKGDMETTTYTRMASNVAELVLRYTKVGNNFNRLAFNTDKYEKYGNQLERYLGTHQGVTESFVAKVLEKTGGSEARNAFLESIGSGFAEIEGAHIEIINKGTEQKILMTYPLNSNGEKEEKSVEISLAVLEDIIKDREKFEHMVEYKM